MLLSTVWQGLEPFSVRHKSSWRCTVTNSYIHSSSSVKVCAAAAVRPRDCAVRAESLWTVPRKYNLPAVFGLPPGFDDCCVHFICMYCASHQEARELVVRGVDGPGRVTNCWHWPLGRVRLSSLQRCCACFDCGLIEVAEGTLGSA